MSGLHVCDLLTDVHVLFTLLYSCTASNQDFDK